MASQAPLTDLRVLELAGLAPGPYLGLLLAQYGASVLRIDRPVAKPMSRSTPDSLTAHKLGSLPLDLKSPASVGVLHSLLERADVLIDPFRPGVLEKLSLGAVDLCSRYPRLIVVHLTGFRRDGKWKDRAGHDINYLAVGGVLSLLGAGDRPPSPPGNLLADFAGGGLNAFSGVLLALLKRATTGKGGVVDANMVDGASSLATFARLATKGPAWSGPRGTNLLDGGCPFYGCYETKDTGKFVAVGALEPQFYNQLLQGLELRAEDVLAPGVKDRNDHKGWSHMRAVMERRFRERTRDQWEQVFESQDACVTPVKEMRELEEEGWINRLPVNVRSMEMMNPSSEAHPSDGVGWGSPGLRVGQNGEEALRHWLGWKKGQQWEEINGAFIKVDRPGSSRL